jgi:hypothetical protein
MACLLRQRYVSPQADATTAVVQLPPGVLIPVLVVLSALVREGYVHAA